jgi:hypothetical protein
MSASPAPQFPDDVACARTKDLRQRLEGLADEATAVAEDAERLAHRLRDRAQWLAETLRVAAT